MASIKTLNIKTFDQFIASLITYAPLVLPIYERDLQVIAQVSTFLMSYSMVLGIIRSTFVNIIYENNYEKRVPYHLIIKAALMFSTPLLLGATILILFGKSQIWFNVALIILISSGIQEIFRQLLLKFEFSKIALISDSTWLVVMLFALPLLANTSNSTLAVVISSWSIGNAMSLIFQLFWIRRLVEFKNFVKKESSILDFFKLGTVSLIATGHGLILNAIFVAQKMTEDLGYYRGLLTFFLPISFITNYQQLILLPLLSKKQNPKREHLEMSITALLLLPFLTLTAIAWVFREYSLSNILIGIFTGLTPTVVLFSNRFNLQLIVDKKSNVLIRLRVIWLSISCLLVTFFTFTSSLLLVCMILLLIEICYCFVARNLALNINSFGNRKML